MKTLKKWFSHTLLSLAALLLIVLGAGYWFLQRSLPELGGKAVLSQLTSPVKVMADRFGIPLIKAENRNDAIRALAYITARDRLFQMELMRRKNAGRLAEVLGELAVASDRQARIYGFYRIAKEIFTKLPPAHKRYLEAYAQGVNSYLAEGKPLPLEFTVLNYAPQAWKPEDSLLIELGMFELLNSWTEQEERMLTVMEKTLSPEILAFLTPDTDRFTDSLLGGADSWRPAKPIPVAALKTALRQPTSTPLQLSDALVLRDFVKGSNAWAVSGSKTRDGRAILANDMHLGLSMPNIWYRCELQYGGTHAAGVNLPGTPLLISGSNEHIAWGSTNLTGDFLDLVTLELNPENPNEYRVANGWQSFKDTTEIIKIKNAPPQQVHVKRTIWGPVAAEPLLGKPVAIHWTALDSDAVNIGLIDLEQAETIPQALDIAHRTGSPELNFLVADKLGHIAWTIMGKIPKRQGMDGSVSRSWADGVTGWQAYVPAGDLPQVIDPEEGFLASANNRRLGKEFPQVIGHEFANGYRAYRISQRLKQMQELNEWSLFQLQLDTENEFYAFYQQLALSVLTPELLAKQPELRELRDTLLAWNGRGDSQSLGLALLEQFREKLARQVFTPFLAACQKLDRDFHYAWLHMDTPLQALLNAKIPGLNPDPVHYANWDELILEQLKQSAEQVRADYPQTALSGLTWGKTNKAHLTHVLFGEIPLLSVLYAMPEDELSGCGGCVRAIGPSFGASERMVVSPAHLAEGLLHMPGGQASHPLSPNYRDQQGPWVQGLPMTLLAGKGEHSLLLSPAVE